MGINRHCLDLLSVCVAVASPVAFSPKEPDILLHRFLVADRDRQLLAIELNPYVRCAARTKLFGH
jgi:thiaminase (transcriptional activator TenA)